jgi:hypothetical protein
MAVDPIDPTIRAEIIRRLRAVERDEDVRILLAVESGSRAWGFASADSDYDVRFIYARPLDWYLSIDVERRRDVIERPITDDIDLNGWDLRKALGLLHRSNPVVVEWLRSPIVYLEHGTFGSDARAMISSVFRFEAGIHHYRSIAANQWKDWLRADRVRVKKYFYAVRPLLAVRWMERYREAPPMEFERLLDLVDDSSLRREIDQLLEFKRGSGEVDAIAPLPRVGAFIEVELERPAPEIPEGDRLENRLELLNRLFREHVHRPD